MPRPGHRRAADEAWSRTHHAYYWSRVDRLAEEALAGAALATMEVEDALLGPEQPLRVKVAEALESPRLSFGDGAQAEGHAVEHRYLAPGVYELVLEARREGADVHATAPVASLRERHSTGFSAVVEQPAGGGIIEGVLPALAFGRIDEGAIALGFAAEASGRVAPDRWQRLDALGAATEGAFETRPERLRIPVVNRATGAVMASFAVDGAVLELAGAEAGRRAIVRGDLSTGAVVDALVAIGGFDARGARVIVAETLGYTAETLPEAVPMRVRWTVGER